MRGIKGKENEGLKLKGRWMLETGGEGIIRCEMTVPLSDYGQFIMACS